VDKLKYTMLFVVDDSHKKDKNAGKFYGTLTNLSVVVHQINKLIVKCVIF